jgi:hypothetical protein
MTKTFTIFASCMILSGCAVQRKSTVWQQVIDAPRVAPSGPNTSEAYSKNLHETLQKAGVPHKVVTYNYPFSSKFDGNGTAQRTSVIYRDVNSPAYPWWIVDERLSRPVWLPTESVERQVNFFLRRPAQVVTLREYGAGDAKAVAAAEPKRRAVAEQVAPTTRIQAVADAERAGQPFLVTRIWRNTKSLFRNDDPTPTAPVAHLAPVSSAAISRIVPVEKPSPVRVPRIEPAPVERITRAPVEKVAPTPVVGEGPKRPLFRPAGVKPRPFFSSF